MLEVSLGAPQRYSSFTLFPLVAEQDRALPYALLADALANRSVVIREFGGGTVPTLEVVNRGHQPLLILDGEHLVGAKQNRMVNRSILVPPHTTLPIPVACVEQGRWHWATPDFRLSAAFSPSKVRRHPRQAEEMALRERGRSAPDDLASAQGRVWEEVGEISYLLEVNTPTGALDEVSRNREGELELWLAALPAVEGQVGLLALAGEEILGVDALGSPGLYRPLHRRLVAGYVLDALALDAARGRRRTRPPSSPPWSGPAEKGGRDPRNENRAQPDEEVPGEGSRHLEKALLFMGKLKGSPRVPVETVGLGEYRLLSGNVLGGELIHEARLVHLSAFPADEGETALQEHNPFHVPPGTPIHRPRRGRRRYWDR